jgi:hypothetical protein
MEVMGLQLRKNWTGSGMLKCGVSRRRKCTYGRTDNSYRISRKRRRIPERSPVEARQSVETRE